MVGVELRATWTQTRKANGDMVQQRVANTTNSWKAGKFMPLTMRPWSINSYVLSKVWFKCGTVDLRVADISAVTSSVKSWLYADVFEKPSEGVMCRPAYYGGLGVTSVKFKAQAILIKTFLETAAIPKFRHSLLHSNLFKFHVLGDSSIPDPGFLPYYQPHFFNTIKYVHEQTPLNVLSMTTSQWVRILTEEGLTMEMVGTRQQFIPCRAETMSPETDWAASWRLCRLAGLSSDLTSFNFKLLHRLLVTRQRLHHLTPAAAPTCSHCGDQVVEDLEHALVNCSYNDGTGQLLLRTVQIHSPQVTASALLRLELNLQESLELPLTTFISTVLLTVWEKRLSRSRITVFDIRTTLEARCTILRKTRFRSQASLLSDIINTM